MEAANRGCKEAGGLSVGFNIALPFEQKLNRWCDLGLTFDHFHVRKVMFVKAAEGFVNFPGDSGRRTSCGRRSRSARRRRSGSSRSSSSTPTTGRRCSAGYGTRCSPTGSSRTRTTRECCVQTIRPTPSSSSSRTTTDASRRARREPRSRGRADPRGLGAGAAVGVVLGSGLGGLADELDGCVEVPYSEIPGWPASTAVGHAGVLVLGSLVGSRWP